MPVAGIEHKPAWCSNGGTHYPPSLANVVYLLINSDYFGLFGVLSLCIYVLYVRIGSTDLLTDVRRPQFNAGPELLYLDT